jgi:DNA-binding CsgD family transcriptional regulator
MDPARLPVLEETPEPAPPFRWRLSSTEESDPGRVMWALGERIKELNCLYAIAQLAEAADGPIEEIFNVVVTIIPPSWQYPEITSARITYREEVCATPGFKMTPWSQSSPIYVFGEQAGEVVVCYSEERPAATEGPFLHEERVLLDAIAERLGALAMRLIVEKEVQDKNQQLMVERQALQETNAALKTVMARIEEEKREIHRDVRDNVEKVLMPIIHELYMAVPRAQRKYVELLRDNLEEIASPFVNKLSQRFQSMTTTEIQVCNMIRSGLRTKEIAELRGVSPATISRHREGIRRKLGIANSDANLATFLQTNM